MSDESLDPILADPDLRSPAASHALLRLARSVSGGDPDIAGDVILMLHETLRPAGRLRLALHEHPNPYGLLQASANNAAIQARRAASRFVRQMPLTRDGTLDELEASTAIHSPAMGVLDVLTELGWTEAHLEALAIPRQRRGRDIHAGIENAIEKLAACFGVTERCPGCPTAMDLLRLDLRGPTSWPALVPVLQEWQWSADLIDFITTSPAQIGHWRDLPVAPPPRQERRMVEVARKMRWEPWLLQDSAVIQLSARSRRVRPPNPPPPQDATIACTAYPPRPLHPAESR